jgi:GT2 family glycosyltransferase
VPYALNEAIRKSGGEVIVRIDAHSEYPRDYLSSLVSKLYELDADNVGGSWITLPSVNTLEAKLIAECTSNPFGIGNAYYRLDTETIRQVDTVPYGCYRREVFEKTGLFDTDLVRNQDDEFNARLINAGGKIYLVPHIKIKYYARDKIRKMITMFYQFGLFKPLVNLKIGKPATLRQFFPFFFILFIMGLIITPLINKSLFFAGLIVLLIYFIFGALFSFKTVFRKKNVAYLILMPIVFFLIHISYGTGYLLGVVRFQIFKSNKIKPVDANR